VPSGTSCGWPDRGQPQPSTARRGRAGRCGNRRPSPGSPPAQTAAGRFQHRRTRQQMRGGQRRGRQREPATAAGEQPDGLRRRLLELSFPARLYRWRVPHTGVGSHVRHADKPLRAGRGTYTGSPGELAAPMPVMGLHRAVLVGSSLGCVMVAAPRSRPPQRVTCGGQQPTPQRRRPASRRFSRLLLLQARRTSGGELTDLVVRVGSVNDAGRIRDRHDPAGRGLAAGRVQAVLVGGTLGVAAPILLRHARLRARPVPPRPASRYLWAPAAPRWRPSPGPRWSRSGG
jgi:hypothetical protein